MKVHPTFQLLDTLVIKLSNYDKAGFHKRRLPLKIDNKKWIHFWNLKKELQSSSYERNNISSHWKYFEYCVRVFS